MRIETERLLIRDLEMEDGEAFSRMAEDGSPNDCGFNRDCKKWMSAWIVTAQQFLMRNDPCQDFLAYTITSKEDEHVIGSIGCSYYDDLQKVGITYFVGADDRGKGYSTEAGKAFLEYFFENYQMEELISTVRDENITSKKVVEKLGFQLLEKKMYQDINDENPVMTCFYSIKKM